MNEQRINGLRCIEEMKLYRNMLCEHDFNTIDCKNCKYYYIRTNNMYNIPSCLKEQIRDWALYHIEKGE